MLRQTPRKKLSPEMVARIQHNAIASKAHQLWERAGRPDGRADEFWFEAERQHNEFRAHFGRKLGEPALPSFQMAVKPVPAPDHINMLARRISGKVIADRILAQAGDDRRGPAVLGVVLVGNDPASRVYVDRKRAACQKAGVGFVLDEFADATTERLIERIEYRSRDVSGQIVQLPLPPHIDAARVLAAIPRWADVDGMHPHNLGLLMAGSEDGLRPCTAEAVVEIMRSEGIDPAGKHVVIVNNTNTIGRPLAMMLSRDAQWGNATVTVCCRHTENLRDICQEADVLVTAVGKPGYKVSYSYVRKGATVIDVAITRDADGRVYGDCDDTVWSQAAAVTPVPGGVGPVTVACLVRNVVKASKGK